MRQPSDPQPVSGPPLTRLNTGELVAATIRSRIFAGDLVSGTRLHQGDLAQQLGVSRIPIREAFIALEREGWVTTRRKRWSGPHFLVSDAASYVTGQLVVADGGYAVAR